MINWQTAPHTSPPTRHPDIFYGSKFSPPFRRKNNYAVSNTLYSVLAFTEFPGFFQSSLVHVSLLTFDQASFHFYAAKTAKKGTRDRDRDRRLRLYRTLTSGWQWSSYSCYVYIDYVIESATYAFLFTSCKTLETNEWAQRTSEFSKVLQQVNKNPYKAPSMW